MQHDSTPGQAVAIFRKPSLTTFASLGMLLFAIIVLAIAFRPGPVSYDIFSGAVIMAIGAVLPGKITAKGLRLWSKRRGGRRPQRP